ncbi:hypothetical protein Tco_0127949 [Tanacetum coccineum]
MKASSHMIIIQRLTVNTHRFKQSYYSMAQVLVSASVVEEGAGESVPQVGEYRRMSRELKESVRRLNVFIAELRALGNCGDDYESLRFLERMQLESMEKCVHLRFIDEGDSSEDK